MFNMQTKDPALLDGFCSGRRMYTLSNAQVYGYFVKGCSNKALKNIICFAKKVSYLVQSYAVKNSSITPLNSCLKLVTLNHWCLFSVSELCDVGTS